MVVKKQAYKEIRNFFKKAFTKKNVAPSQNVKSKFKHLYFGTWLLLGY